MYRIQSCPEHLGVFLESKQMHSATLTYDNIVWEVTYEWEDAQTETEIDPPIPAIATIDQIYVNGIELYEHIDVHTIYALEAMIVESHE